MTAGFAEWCESQGVYVSPPRPWRLEWIDFRQHPCPHEPGVEMYRKALRENAPFDPPVLCDRCYTVLDGWHRIAAHWLEGRRNLQVRFAHQHWMGGKERCMVDQTNWLETLRPWQELDCVSASYHRCDWDVPAFQQMADELIAYGERMPRCRIWEHARAVSFLGPLKDRRILDVGTRESIIPQWLASKGAKVYAIDINPDSIVHRQGVTVGYADATALEFADESFDHILCTATLKHIPGWGDRAATKEMARVLRTGGLLAISVDYGVTEDGGAAYRAWPSDISGRRIYDEQSLYRRIIRPSGLTLQGPVDFRRADYDDWPIKGQSKMVYELGMAQGINVQVAFVLLRKE